jgi:hypothetical protein
MVLNTVQFIQKFDRPPGGSRKDYYEGDDAAFQLHRDTLAAQVRRLAQSPTVFKRSRVAVASVDLVQDALAKSNRPRTLLDPKRLPPVGVGSAGQLLVQVTADALNDLAQRIADAQVELVAHERVDQKTGEVIHEDKPTQARCDVGAIERIAFWSSERRLPLSQQQMEHWLSQSRTPCSLIVQLFTFDTSERAHADEQRRKLVEALEGVGCACTEEVLGKGLHATRYLLVNLAGSATATTPDRAWRERLGEATALLARSFLVRSVALPARLVDSGLPKGIRLNHAFQLPTRTPGRRYPVVGIIDGGLGPSLADWVVCQENVVAPQHGDAEHGTYIGGLLVAGNFLNGDAVTTEANGCDLADLCVLPQDDPDLFQRYYTDVKSFMDELDRVVGKARRDHGVRVFNFSTNFDRPIDADEYAYETLRLDGIAKKHDVIFVISAGNLASNAFRPEWPEDDVHALRMLATARQDQIRGPADSISNVSVTSVNLHGLEPFVPEVPAAYARRGPSPFGGVKPDLAHYGGCAVAQGKTSGLVSTCPEGTAISRFGTSFAAPLAAKTLATYAHQIEGDLSREMLIALLIHHARIPEKLLSVNFQELARDLVGFGIPQDAAASLAGDAHVGTVVFSETIPKGQRLEFEFDWPASLTHQGKCRGRGRLTLVAQPVLDSKYGHEVVRTQLDAHVIQKAAKGKKNAGHFHALNMPKVLHGKKKLKEAELIRHALKWSPVKAYAFCAPQGTGTSSRWRLTVESLERSAGELPEEGTPFVAILTIEDIDGEAPVFDDMKRSMIRNHAQIADIQVAARTRARR